MSYDSMVHFAAWTARRVLMRRFSLHEVFQRAE